MHRQYSSQKPTTTLLQVVTLFLLSLLLSGCTVFGPLPDQMEQTLVKGSQQNREVLIILLPGMLSDANHMQREGVPEAIHRGWSEPDILMADLTLNFYRKGKVAKRLHDDVVLPARQQGYSEIWLAGGSMGGMGALMYEWEHPEELDGLILISPYLGSSSVTDTIREAGGLRSWDSGERSTVMHSDNYDRLVWQMAQGWIGDREKLQRVWLMCGSKDRLFPEVQMLGDILNNDRYFPAPGDHSWKYWIPNMEIVFRAMADSRKPALTEYKP
jgi:pimeloyl-ACP methyl ester carboxylesterase